MLIQRLTFIIDGNYLNYRQNGIQNSVVDKFAVGGISYNPFCSSYAIYNKQSLLSYNKQGLLSYTNMKEIFQLNRW